MEQFQHIVSVGRLHQRNLEMKCLVDDIMQHIGWHIILKGKGGDCIPQFLQGHSSHVAQESLRQSRQTLRQVQSTIRCDTSCDGLFQRRCVVLVFGAIVQHDQSTMTVPGDDGLKVFFTQTGMCFIATGAIVGG